MFTAMFGKKKPLSLLTLAAAFLLSGCALFADRTLDTEEAYYEAAQDYLARDNYSMAIENLNQLQERFPFGRYAQAAALDLMYAQYQSNDFASALIGADRFTRLNSDHPNVDYAWFVQAMSYYELYLDNSGLFGTTDPAIRSPEQGNRAFSSLKVYTDRFPESEYRQEALQAMVLLKDALARHELYVADFYVRKGAWIAAAERAQVIVNRYPGVAAVPDAWVVLVESYGALDLPEDRELALSALRTNYPEHPVFDEGTGEYNAPSWGEDRWWVKILTLGLAS